MVHHWLKTYYFISATLLLGASVNSYAQSDLITNGDFETTSQCPFNLADTNDVVSYARGWKRPTLGKSFYYKACSPDYTGLSVPRNWVGTRLANSGGAYMGLCAFSEPVAGSAPGFKREYIQSELTKPLKAGRRYYFEMFVSRADSGLLGYAVKNLGALFTSNPVSRNDSNQINFNPQIESTSYIVDKVNWTKLSGSFVASGGERFVTIGRFGADDASQLLNINGGQAKQAYYYIDDVKLIDSCSTFDQVVENVLGPDSSFCKYGPLSKTLTATNAQTSNYLWKNGSTFPIITVTDTGKYWVRLTKGSCTNYDTVTIASNIKPTVDLGRDTTICFNRPVTLKSKKTKSFYTYNWYIFTTGISFAAGTGSTYTASNQDFYILKVTDFNCSAYDTILVFKSTMDTLILRPDTALCRQEKFLLNASTTNATKYKWNTGDTTPTIYTSARERYFVAVTDGLCSVRDTINITLLGAQKPIKDTSACENTLLILSLEPSASSYLWSTGATTREIAAYSSGAYTIRQTQNGCTTKDTINVTIDKVPKVNLGGDTSVCIDPLYILKAVSPQAKKFIWNTGDSTQTIQVSETGVYKLRTENNTCWSGDTIEINAQLKVPFSFGEDVSDCFNTNIILTTSPTNLDSFAWSTGVSDSFIVINQPGTYWLITHKDYCTNADTISFFAKDKPTITLRNDTTVCKGTSIILDAKNTQNKVLWSTGETTLVITTSKPGFYLAKVTNNEGCFSVDSFNLYNHEVPTVLKQKNAVVCVDSAVLLAANPNLLSYLWNTGSTTSTIAIDTSGKYWVNITDSFGCKYSDSANVVIKLRPQIFITDFIETCELGKLLETDIPYAHYLWNYADTSNTFTITNYENIHLLITDTNNCSNETTIKVKNSCPASANIPNVFTPNNDGLNDVIIPDYVNIKSTEFKVYNRWGKLVFETTDLTQAWNGKEATTGTYFYTLTCKGNAEEELVFKGTITLLR
jgi:gliding motility-associated-like protein